MKLVTALYDIGRTNIDGRTIDNYIQWLYKTIELDNDFIIYTDNRIYNLLNIKKDNVEFKIVELTDLPKYKYYNSILNILNSLEYKNKIQHPDRIECITPLYNIIQYSKFDLLKDTNDNFVYWIDAGCSRFFNNIIRITNPNIDKFIIQGNINTNHIIIDDNYIYRSDCVLVGTFFGGPKNIVDIVSNKVEEKLNYYLNLGIINNEQIILAYIQKENPELFHVHIDLDGTHLPILKIFNR